MTSPRFRRNRRIFTVIPAAAIAAVLSVAAVAYACVETYGSTNVSVTTLEPGDAFVISATSAPRLNGQFRVKLGTSAAECHHGTVFLGGVVLASVVSADQPHPGHTHGDIPAVTRLIPTNVTSGVKYLCWNEPTNADNVTARAITIV